MWSTGKLGDFEKTEADVYRKLVAAGADPFFVTEQDLAKTGAKVLVLPMSVSVGPAVTGWKGTVLATHAVTHDEYLKPRSAPESFAKFPGSAEDLEKTLSAAGVQPEASVLTPDGRRMPRVVLSVHAFPGHPDAALLMALRDPVGQKEEAGADGVVYMVPDPAAGKPVEAGLIDVSRFAGRRFYDVRARKELSADGGKLKVDLAGGDAVVVAVLPYGPLKLELTATRADDRLAVSVSGGGRAPHVVRLDVVDKATGKADLLYSRSLLLDSSGRISVEIPLAIEDRGKGFELRARDLLTGAGASQTR